MTLKGERLRKLGVLNTGHQRKVLAIVSSLSVTTGDSVTYAGVLAQVRYIGFPRLPNYRGEWIGVEIKPSDIRRLRRVDKSRVNDGTIRGIRYFTARRGCGLLVRRNNITVKKQRSRTQL